MYWESLSFELPLTVDERQWWLAIDTAAEDHEDFYVPGSEKLLKDQRFVQVAGRSIAVLVARTGP
jgi:hypothetical protein